MTFIKIKNGMKLKDKNCTGAYDAYGNFLCGYNTKLNCEECKYGLGNKNPEAKYNVTKRN